MSTTPTPGALSAAKAVTRLVHTAPFDRTESIEEIIDREAVKPATAELLAALKITVAELSTWEEEHGRAPSSVTESARSTIAKHEARKV